MEWTGLEPKIRDNSSPKAQITGERHSSHALAHFIESQHCGLTELDVSWCGICSSSALILAKALGGNQTLRTLNLAFNCFGANGADDDIMLTLCNSLKRDDMLTELNLSHNQIKESGCMVLAQLFNDNSSLQNLCVDGNDIGLGGATALMKHMMDQPHRHVSLNNCEFSTSSDRIRFDQHAPDGAYELNLTRPYDRMVAMHLQAAAYDQVGLQSERCETWVNSHLDGKKWELPLPWDTDGNPLRHNPDLPARGILVLTFRDKKDRKPTTATDDQYQKLHQILEKTQTSAADDRKLGRLVMVCTEMYSFTSAQVEELLSLELGPVKVQVAAQCLANLTDPSGVPRVMRLLNHFERKQAQKILGQFFYFNVDNPTGHYCLNLDHKYDRLVASSLMKINRTERALQILSGRLDTSQYGNWELLRNCSLNNDNFMFTSDWTLPMSGVLILDYVSPWRPPDEAVPLEAVALKSSDVPVMVPVFYNTRRRSMSRKLNSCFCTRMSK